MMDVYELMQQAVDDAKTKDQESNHELAKGLAYDWVNILNVVPTYSEEEFTGYIIMFEYHFSTPKLEGWRKYALEWNGIGGRMRLEDGIDCCYRLAKQLKEEIESDPELAAAPSLQVKLSDNRG